VGNAIEAEGLRRSYGETVALAGVDLAVPEGTVLGVLGPNGAGKTTAVRILTTLLRPDAGRATVAGLDVVADAAKVRQIIGLAGQYAAVDENLTGRENLHMIARLYHLGRGEAARRADELLERFELTAAADRAVKTYSGGMRRRLDLGASLVNRPSILFLDEPTTGLDPRSRTMLWGTIRQLVSDGTTLLLTTQYLEEADVLADRISVIDLGRVIAEGTADELKTRVGGDRIDVRVAHAHDLSVAANALTRFGEAQIDEATQHLKLPVTSGTSVLADVVRQLDDAGVEITELALRRPTLDDVFLSLTGSHAEDSEPEPSRRRPGTRAKARSVA
jgi:ABC-2 type transport system ATP-binding protein